MKNFTLIFLLSAFVFASCNDDDKDEAVMKIPPLGDNSSIVRESRLRVVSSNSTSTNPEFPITKSCDEDKESYFESSAINGGADYFPIRISYRFTGETDLDYIKYTPKPNSTRGSITRFYIDVVREGSSAYSRLGEFTLDGSAETSIIELERVTKVKAVQFVISSAVDNIVTCSDMQFWNNSKDSFDPLTIFTDELCREVKPEVDQAAIDTIPIKFYKNLAEIVKIGYPENHKEYRLREFKPYTNPLSYARITKATPYSILDNPTGIYVDENEDIVVFMGQTYGKRLRILIQNLDNGYRIESFSLKVGANTITSTYGGLLYVQYLTLDGTGEPVDMHFAGGKINGYFDTNRHPSSEWAERLNSAPYKFFDLVGKMSHMCYPVESFKQFTPDGAELAAVTDSIVFFQHQLMGLYKYKTPISNRLYMHVHYNDEMYMYATTYLTAYHVGTLNQIANPALLKTTALWGPAHEIGHINQTRPGFLWAGMTEVSNNLYSQYTQQRFGLETRLASEKVGTYVNRFEKAYNELLNNVDSTHLMCDDVFCKLVPFWQLQLYFGTAGHFSDLYPDFFDGLRKKDEAATIPLTNGELQLDFVKRMCDIAKLNLIDFFTAWGMLTPLEETIDDYGEKTIVITPEMIAALKKDIETKAYAKPVHRIEYIQDNNIDNYKNNSEIVTGQVSIDNLTVTATGWQNVVAYEVYVADKLVAVHTASTFTVSTMTNCKIYAISAMGTKVALN